MFVVTNPHPACQYTRMLQIQVRFISIAMRWTLIDLTSFQVGYDEDGHRMEMPQPKSFELIPPRKLSASAQAGSSTSSNILKEDMEFEALSSM